MIGRTWERDEERVRRPLDKTLGKSERKEEAFWNSHDLADISSLIVKVTALPPTSRGVNGTAHGAF